jgi:hypothetical protein
VNHRGGPQSPPLAHRKTDMGASMRILNVAGTLTLVVFVAGQLFAEDAEQPLVGARVRLTTGARQETQQLVGDLLGLDDHSLKLKVDEQSGPRDVLVPRATIVRLERSRARGTRGKGAGIGLLEGAVVGGVLGFAAGGSCHGNEFLCFDRSATVPGLGLFFGAVGAGIGALAGHGERWEDVPADRFRVAIGPVRGRGVTARLSFSF